jgi:hypothetical protein
VLYGTIRFHIIERCRAMQDKYQTYSNDPQPRPAAEVAAERKAQIALEQAAHQADKERNLARQRSMDTAPEVRIALWEARHGLALPRDPNHPLIQVIADGTELDVVQVQDERRRRDLLHATPAG